MSKKLKQVINLSKKTGDRIIVFDNSNPGDSFVLMSIEQYEDLLKISSSEKREIENLNNNLDSNLKKEEKGDPLEIKEESSSQEKEEEVKDFADQKEESFEENLELKKEELENSSKISSDLGQKLNDGPLKETLQNLLTEKKIIDKINNIEKNNINSSATSSFKGNNWKIPLDVKEDSE